MGSDDEDPDQTLRAMTPTVKRSSVSSISSVVSLSNHPAISKLGMNDFQDDSAVKIYLNRRRPASQNRMPEPNSEFSSYSTSLSTVQESSPDSKVANWSSAPGTPSNASDATATPPTPQQAQMPQQQQQQQPPPQRYNPLLTVNVHGQASPERFSSPSAKFTIQLLIERGDLPDTLAFDPCSDAIIPKALAKERETNATMSMEARRKIFILPRNVTVLEAIEQGLDRFGIQEGVVDGGDDVEAKNSGRSSQRVKYRLIAVCNGEGQYSFASQHEKVRSLNTERQLMPSSKVLDAYMTPPQLRPAERTTPDQRRRSRDHSQNVGQPSDVQPTDPLFVLRKVNPRGLAGMTQATPIAAQQHLASPEPHTPMTGETSRFEGRATSLSPQEIIAAQRAATRANQRALISAHTNTNQGVDVVLPDKGTFRSSRLLEPNGGEVVRYSFIDDDGQTYDISEILEEELGVDGSNINPPILAPPLIRHGDSSQSNYVTAPSTPLEQPESSTPRGSEDILRGVLARSQGQPEGKLEEKLSRVISKVKSWRRQKSPIRRERQQGAQFKQEWSDDTCWGWSSWYTSKRTLKSDKYASATGRTVILAGRSQPRSRCHSTRISPA